MALFLYPDPFFYLVGQAARVRRAIAKGAISNLVNRRHGRTLQAIFTDPVNGNIEWRLIEALFLALGAARTERAGAAVSFELNGIVA